MRSNTSSVRNKIQDHIKEYFGKDMGWDSSDAVANLKLQLKSFDYMPTTYAMGEYMVDAGSFLVYYQDVEKFLLSLDLDFSDREYDNMQMWDLYKHLLAREIAKLAA